jgi:hypothetical protein
MMMKKKFVEASVQEDFAETKIIKKTKKPVKICMSQAEFVGACQEYARILQDQDGEAAVRFAINVIQGRFPEAEPIIVENGEDIYLYALSAIGGRWLEAEKYIGENLSYFVNQTDVSKYFYLYACDIIKGRFPEAEPVIGDDAELAFKYAAEILKGRFVEGEQAILDSGNPIMACDYAIEVLKSRWFEAEDLIGSDLKVASLYAEHFGLQAKHNITFHVNGDE